MLDTIAAIGKGIADWFSGERNRDTQMEIADRNIALQREFAQNGLSWKIADAMRNKDLVNPAYSLGASTTSFSPVSVGGDMSGGLANMGQNIDRAVSSMQSNEDRASTQMKQLALDRAGLENELLRSKIRRENAQLGPGVPKGSSQVVPGQGDTDELRPYSAPIPAKDPSDVARIKVGGLPIYLDPQTSSGQDIEDALGDEGFPAYLVKNAAQIAHLWHSGKWWGHDYNSWRRSRLALQDRLHRGRLINSSPRWARED